MDILTHFSRMAGNNLWSNDRLYRAVLQLKPGEFEAERTSFFRRSRRRSTTSSRSTISISISWRRVALVLLPMMIMCRS
ncbi:hypothetical protein AJ88_39730 [Mesorhizobium amorphae CCBAU 01583]|nr:hypothetical protein AJ88_39730 [Mesorhizobium amorphae CCBAU 01583]